MITRKIPKENSTLDVYYRSIRYLIKIATDIANTVSKSDPRMIVTICAIRSADSSEVFSVKVDILVNSWKNFT